MKKIISLITGVLLSGTLISCNSTKILEENTKSNKLLNKYSITERNINIKYEDKIFKPLFYDEDGVNGILKNTKLVDVNSDEISVPYILKEDGEFIKEENKYFSKEGMDFINRNGRDSYRGIYSEGLHTRGHIFYYTDIEKNIKFELDGYNEIYYKVIDKFKFRYSKDFQINDDYFITELYNMTDYYEYKGEKLILIIDIKNQTYYTDIIKADPNMYYYDKKEEAIMAIDYQGKIQKVYLKDRKIYFEDFYKINISNLGIEGLFDNKKAMFNRYIVSGDNLIFEIRGEAVFENVIYNMNTKNIKLMNKEIYILSEIENSKFFVVNTSTVLDNKVYLAEIGDNYEFDLIYKLSELENYDNFMVKANKDSSSIFFALESYNYVEGEEPFLKDSKYLFLDIENN